MHPTRQDFLQAVVSLTCRKAIATSVPLRAVEARAAQDGMCGRTSVNRDHASDGVRGRQASRRLFGASGALQAQNPRSGVRDRTPPVPYALFFDDADGVGRPAVTKRGETTGTGAWSDLPRGAPAPAGAPRCPDCGPIGVLLPLRLDELFLGLDDARAIWRLRRVIGRHRADLAVGQGLGDADHRVVLARIAAAAGAEQPELVDQIILVLAIRAADTARTSASASAWQPLHAPILRSRRPWRAICAP